MRAITPLYFVATKLEAFQGRGAGDYQASHDLEDILTVLSGLPRLREQIASGRTTVATFVRTELLDLGAKEGFIDAVPAHFEGDLVGQLAPTSCSDGTPHSVGSEPTGFFAPCSLIESTL